MKFTHRELNAKDPDGILFESLSPVVNGLGMSLLELSIFRSRGKGRHPGTVRIKAVVYKDGVIGVDDCSRIHQGIIPRLELAFPGQDINLEVSSPGIDRLIKDGSEFAFYTGKSIKCYCTDISDWRTGVLLAADEEKLVLREESGETVLNYETIAKARLNGAVQPLAQTAMADKIK